MAALAFALSLLAALASYRWSRLCAVAFALAFGASALYLGLAHLAPLRHAACELELLRLVSLVTGAMGVVELVRGVRFAMSPSRRARIIGARANEAFCAAVEGREPPPYTNGIKLPRSATIASLLVASSLVDGASWLWWRETGQWGPLPAVSCLLYAGVCVVGFWRRGKV